MEMLSSLIAKGVGAAFRWRVRRLGARVEFGKVPEGFLQGFVSSDLTSVWRDQGLPVHGIGIFTVGMPTEQGHSTRYSPESPCYQASFGAYLFEAPQEFVELDEGVPNLNNLFQLAIEDQNYWLKSYGDPNPVTFPIPGTESVSPDISLTQGSGTLVEMKFKTHVDMGNSSFRTGVFGKVLGSLFTGTDTVLSEDFLVAPILETPYSPIVLHGYGLVVRDEERGLTAFGFASVTEKQFPALRDALLESLLTLRIAPTG